jgi:hypothetical protein
MERAVLDAANFAYGRIDLIERLLSALADRKWSVSRPTVERVTQYSDRWRVPLLKAQLMRLVGDFAGAAEIFNACGAIPYLARARVELAESRGDQPDPESVAVLQRLGDIEYLEAHQLGG